MLRAGPEAAVDMAQVEVVAPNFKRRLSGVTSTIVQLVPLLSTMVNIATLGPGLPADLPKITWRQLPNLLRAPARKPFRIWHARRNVEMLGGIVLRDLCRGPVKLVFTSASQRRHTRWSKFLIRRMDAIVATSRKTAAYLDVPNKVVMHGIDVARFRPPQQRAQLRGALGLDRDVELVGCFGRVRHQKGTDLFVDAMIRLLPDRPGWAAVIAGRTTPPHRKFEDDLRRRVAQAGLSDRILFVGEHSDIWRWYQALSLFVAPQRWEGFGLTPLEAMATGVPVVACDVGAFSELVPDAAGVLVPAGDLDAMIAAIKSYMDDEERRRAAGVAALDHVRASFRLEREANELAALYEQLWAGTGG